MSWTEFHDMHSGGGTKEEWGRIYIEAPEDEAKVIFYNRFGHNPDRVTCTCCGEDYSIEEYETLSDATGYDRGCKYTRDGDRYLEEPAEEDYRGPYVPLEDYIAAGGGEGGIMSPRALFIFAQDIKPDEREGSVPEEGYVWV